MPENIFEVNDANFEAEVLKALEPVLVDFWAPWCGPCRALAPTIEAVAKEQAGKVKVCKLNVDDSPQTAAKYNIRGIPTLIFFNNGNIVNQITGSAAKKQIDDLIQNA